MKNVVLRTNGLNKTFKTGDREQQVLRNLNIEIYENDYTVIMGASGAGKSTLLYALSGMDKVSGGSVRFFESDIDDLSADKLAVFRRKNCGFVFQQMFLLDNMSILDNILACGLLLKGDRKAIIAYAKMLLEDVGLTETEWRKFPTQLSGGENQRAAIVRALINKPGMIFADEPTGSLNSTSSKAVLDVLSQINSDGQNIVMVTHDINSALRGNRVLYIKDGDISGECDLGEFAEGSKERHDKLQSFLQDMGW